MAKQANKKVDQTKKQMLVAVDGYFDFLKMTISSYPSGGTELGERVERLRGEQYCRHSRFHTKTESGEGFSEAFQI